MAGDSLPRRGLAPAPGPASASGRRECSWAALEAEMLGAGTQCGTCPERAGYAREGEAAIMRAVAEAPSRRGKRRPLGRGIGFVARSLDRRNRQ